MAASGILLRRRRPGPGPAPASRRGRRGTTAGDGLRAVRRVGVRHPRGRDHPAVRRGADRLVGDHVLPAVQPAHAEHAVRGAAELPADGARPDRGPGHPAHAGLHRAVRARDDDRRAVPGRGHEPEDPLHLVLPDRGLRDDGHLHDQRGDRLHLAVRPLLRGGQLLPQPGRRPAAAVPQLAVPGAVRDRDHDHLGLDRVLGRHLPGRPAGRPAGAAGGGRDRRVHAVADVPPGHPAAAQPGVAVPGRVADHQRAAAVRRGLPEHPGRPAQRHHRARLLPLRPGLPGLQLRLRLGHRLFPVRHHPRGHRDPVPGRPRFTHYRS